MLHTTKIALLGGVLALAGSGAALADAHGDVSACLITKTDTNPFFVKMREGAEAAAEELGIGLSSFAGQFDGDNETQIAAIETCIASGASGILITASDTAAIAPALDQAREAGLLIIALDTPLDPADASSGPGPQVNWATRRPTHALRSSTSSKASRPWAFCATRAS